MLKINENYLKLPGSYLFSTIAKKVNAYTEANPDKKVIRLGIGGRKHNPLLRLLLKNFTERLTRWERLKHFMDMPLILVMVF